MQLRPASFVALALLLPLPGARADGPAKDPEVFFAPRQDGDGAERSRERVRGWALDGAGRRLDRAETDLDTARRRVAHYQAEQARIGARLAAAEARRAELEQVVQTLGCELEAARRVRCALEAARQAGRGRGRSRGRDCDLDRPWQEAVCAEQAAAARLDAAQAALAQATAEVEATASDLAWAGRLLARAWHTLEEAGETRDEAGRDRARAWTRYSSR